MTSSCLFIIFGATGDLTKRKLIPAVYKLALNKRIKDFAIVGISRESFTPKQLINRSKPFVKNINKEICSKLQKRYYHFSADFYDKKKFKELDGFLKQIEEKHNIKNRLFYLATLPQHFEVITSYLGKNGLAKQNKQWSRIVFEKPFGHDLKSARKINKCIQKVFSEKQIYRIDHYLGKELVQNISIIRFTNTILEPLWNKKYIDHVQIVLSESLGVEKRGAFYDKYGALKDVVQNHMLQLVCLTAIEAPHLITGEYIRSQKLKILKAIKPVRDIVLGQYQGYQKEKGVKHNSKTETFAALKLAIDNKRWKGVPFYLITGKGMKEKIASIYIQFKESPCLLLSGICNFLPNYLVIQIQPEEGFYFQFNGKAPGKLHVVPIKMDFCHSCLFGPNTPEAYENLLFNVIEGDQSVFIRSDEIEQAWKIIDRIKKPKLHIYKKASYPEQAKKLIEKDNRYWHLQVK